MGAAVETTMEMLEAGMGVGAGLEVDGVIMEKLEPNAFEEEEEEEEGAPAISKAANGLLPLEEEEEEEEDEEEVPKLVLVLLEVEAAPDERLRRTLTIFLPVTLAALLKVPATSALPCLSL